MSYVTFVELDGTTTNIRFRTLRSARYAAALALQTKGLYKSAYAWRA